MLNIESSLCSPDSLSDQPWWTSGECVTKSVMQACVTWRRNTLTHCRSSRTPNSNNCKRSMHTDIFCPICFFLCLLRNVLLSFIHYISGIKWLEEVSRTGKGGDSLCMSQLFAGTAIQTWLAKYVHAVHINTPYIDHNVGPLFDGTLFVTDYQNQETMILEINKTFLSNRLIWWVFLFLLSFHSFCFLFVWNLLFDMMEDISTRNPLPLKWFICISNLLMLLLLLLLW